MKKNIKQLYVSVFILASAAAAFAISSPFKRAQSKADRETFPLAKDDPIAFWDLKGSLSAVIQGRLFFMRVFSSPQVRPRTDRAQTSEVLRAKLTQSQCFKFISKKCIVVQVMNRWPPPASPEFSIR